MTSKDPLRLLRFITVGISNTILSFVVFILTINLLPAFSGRTCVAQTVSYLAGIGWSYLWNRNWVFKSQANATQEGGKFIIIQLTLLCVSVAAISISVDIIGTNPTLTWPLVMAIITILNYKLLQTWAFSRT